VDKKLSEPKSRETKSKSNEEITHYIWEQKIITTVSGTEQWWVKVGKTGPALKSELWQRYPLCCVNCDGFINMADPSFVKYSLPWQPLCHNCYIRGVQLLPSGNLLQPNSEKQTSKLHKTSCHWCMKSNISFDSGCSECNEYLARVQRDFYMSQTEAKTWLYAFLTPLRKQRTLSSANVPKEAPQKNIQLELQPKQQEAEPKYQHLPGRNDKKVQ